jgi:hypothetical protein
VCVCVCACVCVRDQQHPAPLCPSSDSPRSQYSTYGPGDICFDMDLNEIKCPTMRLVTNLMDFNMPAFAEEK